jgi:intracellular sulfur oxidation DsrE/DsrF family protein
MIHSKPQSPPSSEAPVSRRSLVGRIALSIAAAATAFRSGDADAEEVSAQIPRVAYGLSDAEKVNFALGNIRNHIEGMGGPDKVHIVLVVNGPALAAFRADRANEDLARRLADVAGQGVELGACGNTMQAQKLTVADLLPGFVPVDEGGVTRLAKLQAEGYAYIRP